MKKHILILGMALMIALTGMGQEMKGRRGSEKKESKIDQLAMKLELTDNQKASLDDAMVAHHKAVQPLKNQMAEYKAKLNTLKSADRVDQKAINQTIENIGQLQTSILKEKTNHHIAMRAMLTDKQKVAFDQMKEKGRGERKPSHQKGK